GHRPHKRSGKPRAQNRKCKRGRCIASNDDKVGLDFLQKTADDRNHSFNQILVSKPSIGKTRIVRGVNQSQIGALTPDFPKHGQAAETRVEDQNRVACFPHHPYSPVANSASSRSRTAFTSASTSDVGTSMIL